MPVHKTPLPSSQLIRKKLIERSIKTLTKCNTVQKFKVQSKLKSTTQKSLSIPPDVSSQPREITLQEIIAHDKSLPQSTDSYTDTVDPYKKIPSNVTPDKTNINEFPPLPPDIPQ